MNNITGTTPAVSEARTDNDETFTLPDYFNQMAKSPNQNEQPTIVVILWDEVARNRKIRSIENIIIMHE